MMKPAIMHHQNIAQMTQAITTQATGRFTTSTATSKTSNRTTTRANRVHLVMRVVSSVSNIYCPHDYQTRILLSFGSVFTSISKCFLLKTVISHHRLLIDSVAAISDGCQHTTKREASNSKEAGCEAPGIFSPKSSFRLVQSKPSAVLSLEVLQLCFCDCG